MINISTMIAPRANQSEIMLKTLGLTCIRTRPLLPGCRKGFHAVLQGRDVPGARQHHQHHGNRQQRRQQHRPHWCPADERHFSRRTRRTFGHTSSALVVAVTARFTFSLPRFRGILIHTRARARTRRVLLTRGTIRGWTTAMTMTTMTDNRPRDDDGNDEL